MRYTSTATKPDARITLCVSGVMALLLMVAATPAHAALDLRNATVSTLDNGLTLILLEDHRFPVTSVQMLYRIGARDEVSGKTGLAHFLEHMAFRDSKNFPRTDLVSRIYAAGGEWHGYTWTDQTTYFATVPNEHLDLLLQIEADRMTRLNIQKEHMEAERGAVLTEMHMYENLPTSMLIDAVNFISFLAHPYRNNTIGWESDIENLQHRDVVEFYKRHYHPANAVLAIVGDFDPDAVHKRVNKLFKSARRQVATPLPHTTEPLQNGVRRVTLHGNSEPRQFMIAYRAPSASHPDFATFLVMQEILGTGSGVSFLQNDWGTAVDDHSLLSGAAEALTTWYPPSAQNYVFVIGGIAPDGDTEMAVEQRIEDRVASLRQQAPANPTLVKAIGDVQDALVFDVQTTEDAAHQLAFFDGLHALDTLLNLPEQVASVTAADVQRVAASWLLPQQRSIAWHLPQSDSKTVTLTPPGITVATPVKRPLVKPDHRPAPAPVTAVLSGGIPVILKQSDLSSTAQIQLVLPASRLDGAKANEPIPGYSSIVLNVLAPQLAEAMVQASDKLAALEAAAPGKSVASTDPSMRLQQEFAALMQTDRRMAQQPIVPALIVVAGDIEADRVLVQLEEIFGPLKYEPGTARPAMAISKEDDVVKLGLPVAQAALGYIVPAPGPRDRMSDAWQLLLYILSHDYEGRLGTKAISASGLVYYIGSQYRSDGTNAWITLSTGVDPLKIAPVHALLSAELKRLVSEPPTEAEVTEAKSHRLGRLKSSAQSNAELSTQLATQWLWYGETLTTESLFERLDKISRQDVLDAARLFIEGTTIVVSE